MNASEECPFKQASVAEQIPARLQDGNLASALIGTPENPTTDNTQLCPHNSTFFAAPNAQEVIQLQMLELQQRAAAQNPQTPQTPPPADTPVSDTQ